MAAYLDAAAQVATRRLRPPRAGAINRRARTHGAAGRGGKVVAAPRRRRRTTAVGGAHRRPADRPVSAPSWPMSTRARPLRHGHLGRARPRPSTRSRAFRRSTRRIGGGPPTRGRGRRVPWGAERPSRLDGRREGRRHAAARRRLAAVERDRERGATSWPASTIASWMRKVPSARQRQRCTGSRTSGPQWPRSAYAAAARLERQDAAVRAAEAALDNA